LVLALVAGLLLGPASSVSARQAESGSISTYSMSGYGGYGGDPNAFYPYNFSASSDSCVGGPSFHISTTELPMAGSAGQCDLWLDGGTTFGSLSSVTYRHWASGTGWLSVASYDIEFNFSIHTVPCGLPLSGLQMYCGYLAGNGTDTYTGAEFTLGGDVMTDGLCCGSFYIAGSLTYTMTKSAAPANTERPVVSGTPEDGEMLDATSGTWSGDDPKSYTYQWRRCDAYGENCSDIPGAVSDSYRLTSADVERTIRARVTAVNDAGTDYADADPVGPVAPRAPASETAPVVAGAPVEGQTLRTTDGTWSGTTPQTYGYEWRRCDANGTNCERIEGQTASAYVLTDDDVARTVRSRVTASNSGGQDTRDSDATPVIVAELTDSGQYSGSCTDGDAKVVEGFAGSAYVSLRAQEHPTDEDVTWVCYRAWDATGSLDVGGRVDLKHGGGTPGLPALEADSSGCSTTPVDLKVGPNETPIAIGINSTPSEVRACFRVDSFHHRVTVSAPGVGSDVPVIHQDDPTVPDPQERQGDATRPSSTCQNTPGKTRLANLEAGGTWIAAYSAPGGPGETRLCVRGQGPVSAGGMLTVTSTTGMTPVVSGPVPDTSPSSCASNVLSNGSDPARFSIRVTATNPASLCLSVGSSGQFGPPGQRFTVGTSGSPAVPVVWTPDPGTPG
jgi:hypothetical protein